VNFKRALKNLNQLQTMVIGLLATNTMMAAGLIYAMSVGFNTHERLVIIPPHLDEKAVIAWDTANKEYMESFGLYVASLVGNIQPRSANFIIEAISAFMDPRIYPEFRRQAMAIVNDPVFKSSGAIMTFLPSQIQYEAETSRVFVLGNLVTKTNNRDQQKKVIYEVGMSIKEGRPFVTHFTSYEGTIPRTVSWHIAQSEKSGEPIPAHALPFANRQNVQ